MLFLSDLEGDTGISTPNLEIPQSISPVFLLLFRWRRHSKRNGGGHSSRAATSSDNCSRAHCEQRTCGSTQPFSLPFMTHNRRILETDNSNDLSPKFHPPMGRVLADALPSAS